MNGKRVLLAAATLHFTLIGVVALRDTFAVLMNAETVLPNEWKSGWARAEENMADALGRNLSKRNALRQALASYLNAAGIEAGYGFFAPNIPGTNKLVFELHYRDGRVEHELPSVRSSAAALRLASLLDLTARVKDETVRQGLIKYLVYAVWREHTDVTSIRAILGSINFPPPADFARGERESYQASNVYDFTFEAKPQN